LKKHTQYKQQLKLTDRRFKGAGVFI